MTRYLVLYDNNGNCQYVAIARIQASLARYLEAGFIEVSEDEYQRCAAIVDTASLADLQNIITATQLLGSLVSVVRPPQTALPPDNRIQLDDIIAQQERNVTRLTRQLFAEDIDVQQWYDANSRQLVRSRLASRATAVGGVQNLSQQDIDTARQAARDDLRYLSQFRDELENGTLSEAQAIQRARMYAGGNREQYERARQDLIGLPELPAQPGVRTVCRKNCKCRWDIVRLQGNGNFDCFWRRSPVDSCETCLARERAFNPLRIRNGVIQPFPITNIYR